jgi:hypothetical protein
MPSMSRAEEMKTYAMSISPEDTGQYKDSVRDQQGRTPRRPARALTVQHDPIAGLLEYGSIHNPEFAVLARTAHQFGGSVDH